MNKDVIYVDPENDVTDIIGKIENSPEKIVVLVPPKKAGIFRSMVNIKLMAKMAASSEKTVVLVTSDPSITKLAAAARIPVTKDLKVPPRVPELDDEILEESEAEIVEADDDGDLEVLSEAEEEEIPVEKYDEEEPDESDEDAEEDPKAAKKAAKAAKKAAKKGKNRGGVLGWIKSHKVPVAIAAVAAVAGVAFLIWAFGFAPKVEVTAEIQTENKSFAENVSFTTNPADEKPGEGIFYLQEQRTQEAQEVKFEATGKVNQGEKASGKLTISYVFEDTKDSPVTVRDGDGFSAGGQSYTVESGTTLAPPTRPADVLSGCKEDGCTVSDTISVVANEPGSQYNTSNPGTISIGGYTFSASGSISGGTDKEVPIVEQIDVERAKNQLTATNEDEIKKKLFAQIQTSGDTMIIENSFSVTSDNATATPAAGQEVGAGVTPVLKATTTATIYTIDKSKLQQFIKEKAQISDDQEVYQVNEPYIENFALGNGTGTGRLKASYSVGPKITESQIADRIKGKGIGDAQHDLKSINGIVGVTINGNYPWVTSVPDDTNKITVELKVKDQNGNSSDGNSGNSENASGNGQNSGNNANSGNSNRGDNSGGGSE